MPQLILTIPDFSINSTFYTYNVYGEVSYGNINPGTKTFSFDTSHIPAGSTIDSALLNASWGGSLYGGTAKQAGSTSKTNVDVTALVTAGVDTPIEYYFKTNTGGTTQGSHSSTLSFTGCQMIVNYTLPFSSCRAPSTASLSATLSEGDVALNYSGAAGGTNNTMSGLEVQYSESNDNVSWGAWTAYVTVATGNGSGSFSVAPSSTRARYRKYRLRTQGTAGSVWYSGWIETGSVRRNSLPGTPSSLRFNIPSGSYFFSGIQCLWNNGSDLDGNFSGIFIRLARYNHDSSAGTVGWAWLDTGWVWLGNVTSITFTRAQLIAKGAKPGDTLGFGLVAQDALGAQNWDASGMPASGYVYLAADPLAPDAFSASPPIQETGITLTWSGASGGGPAIAGYDIECKIASTAAGVEGTDGYTVSDDSPISSSASFGSKSDSSNITRGYFERWRIRSFTSEGTKSVWKYSNTIQKNKVPITPGMLFPATGKTIYNTQPFIGLTISAEPDGQTQTLYYSIDGGASQNAGIVTAGTKKMRLPALTVGNHILRFWLQDSLAAFSENVEITLTVAANTYTRTITGYVSDQQPGTLLWDEENALRTSAEILELKSRLNEVRAYYGLAAINLPYEATTGTSTIKHFHTWMPNMTALYQGLAETGTISGATVPARVTKARNAPSAGVVNQIRIMIGSL